MIDEAVRQVRAHFGAIFLPVSIPVAVCAGLVPLTQAAWMTAALRGQHPDFAAVAPAMILWLLALVLYLLAYGLGNGAMLVAASDALAGRAVAMKRAWTLLLRPRALGTLLLSWMFVAVGLLCCLLPGLYLMLRYAFVVPVMVEERRYGLQALRRSAALARHNPQRSLGSDPRVQVLIVLFLGVLIGYVVGMLVQLPLIVAQQVLVMRSIAEGAQVDPASLMADMYWLQAPAQVLGTLANCAVQLYVSFVLVHLFMDVRYRKEGGDLEAAVREMESRSAAGLAELAL
jgi:hypothetical protein